MLSGRDAADCYEKREGHSRNWDSYGTRTIAASSVLAYLYPP